MQHRRRSKGQNPTEGNNDNVPERASARLEIIPVTFMMCDNLCLHKLKRLTDRKVMIRKNCMQRSEGESGLLFMQAGDTGSLAKARLPEFLDSLHSLGSQSSILASLKWDRI